VTPERLREIEALFHQARARPPADREAWLARACTGDPALRREVESLLAQPPVGLIDAPVGALIAGLLRSPMAALANVTDSRSENSDGFPLPSVPSDSSDSDHRPAILGLTSGSTFASRYRIVRRIGCGGMGEVYRAEDLTLGQPVALKLLHSSSGDIRTSGDRLIAEVRIARNISHPNVCRVYDIGRADGLDYLSMEYVDGKTLSALLRAGRLPAETAIDITRQICAGLAAAHDRGVLHRDIKPSNIMLDGHGRVRLVDFGLACVAHEAAQTDAGTPGYMAPELRSGGQPTCRSDIYALGIVMYELFAGVRIRNGVDSTGSAPDRGILNTLARDEPVIAAIIRRCLADDPAARPGSASDVAAMLPDGDPFAAAAARGRLPSPVSEPLGDNLRLRPAVARWAAALAIAMTLLAGAGTDAMMQLGLDTLPSSADDLAGKSEQILRMIVPGASWSDHDYWFEPAAQPPRSERSPDRGRRAIRFVYRASASSLRPRNLFRLVTKTDPPANAPGTATVVLDAFGNLLGFLTISNNLDASDGPAPDWDQWFGLAGLDRRELSTIEATSPISVPHDRELAWQRRSERGVSERIRAATLRDTPTFFSVTDDAMQSSQDDAPWTTHRGGTIESFLWMLVATVFLASWIVAERNRRKGVGHRFGAQRIGAFIACSSVLGLVLRGHHVAVASEEFGFLFEALGWSLAWGALSWLTYLAAEPYIRRMSLLSMTSWIRVVDGRFRDSMVGRDLLIGVCAGATMAMAVAFRFRLVPHRNPDMILFPALDTLRSWRHLAFAIDDVLLESVVFALGGAFAFVIGTRLLRNRWAAAAALMLVSVPLTVGGVPQTWLDGLCVFAITAIATIVVVRAGLLALVATYLIERLLTRFPIDLDVRSWHFGATSVVLLLIVGLAIYAGAISRMTHQQERTATG
jgi:serine/threonine-protein kinase